MFCKHLFLLFISFLFSIYLCFAQPGNLKFEHIDYKQGFPEFGYVFNVFQCSDGFIWITTISGLYRYDGYTFKAFEQNRTDTTSLSLHLITSRLFEDKSGFLWLGTSENWLNKFNKHTEKVTRYKLWDQEGNAPPPQIREICEDEDGMLWIATTGGTGLCKFDPESGKHEYFVYKNDPGNYLNIHQSLLIDNKGTIWLASSGGVLTFDPKSEEFQVFKPEFFDGLNITTILEEENTLWFSDAISLYKYERMVNEIETYKVDGGLPEMNVFYRITNISDYSPEKQKSFWITTTYGLRYFDKATGESVLFTHDPQNSNSLFHNTLYSCYVDRSRILWLPHANFGIDKVILDEGAFKNYSMGPFPPDQFRYAATSFVEGNDEELWVGSHEGGVFIYDKNMDLKDRYKSLKGDQSDLEYNHVTSMLKDSRQKIWIATKGWDIKDICQVHHFSKRKEPHLSYKLNYPDSIRHPLNIADILEDQNGNIWLGTNRGLFVRGIESQSTGFYYTQAANNPIKRINDIFEDHLGVLWIGTSSGLFEISLKDKTIHIENHYKYDNHDSTALLLNYVYAVYEDSNRNIWAGTYNGLIRISREDRKFERYLENTKIYAIHEDSNGHFWLPSDRGLYRFDIKANPDRRIRYFGQEEGLPFEDYPSSSYKNKHGKIFVGSSNDSGNGFYTFDPSDIVELTDTPKVVLTSFKVNHELQVYDSSISVKKNLILKHSENSLSFEFAVLDYRSPVKNNFAYKLEGVDEDWLFVENRNYANYTNLFPGEYIFRIKGSNSSGIWNEAGTWISIKIKPSPWKTAWAYALYFLALLALIFFWRRYDLKRQRIKKDLEIKQVQNEKLEELDQLKSQFFANISHEFRTPLTLILSPAEKLLSKITNEKHRSELLIIHRYARRLRRLINQLLNLSKLEAGKLKLNPKKENIVQLVRGFTQSFESHAAQRQIKLLFSSESEETIGFVDRNKLEIIINNLLSNAFKFTPEEGQVSVFIKSIPDDNDEIREVHIVVTDSGSGIPEDKLEKIFERFYLVDESNSHYHEGTGIGLALAKELVELHNGEIKVENNPDSPASHPDREDKGATFTVILPLEIQDQLAEDKDELEQMDGNDPEDEFAGNFVDSTIQYQKIEEKVEAREQDDTNSKPVLLVVEDNLDLRTHICFHLSEEYDILEAKNGDEGLNEAVKYIPDLIISDVMMPKMDGYELSIRLKKDERTCHIPVILLTALASKENRIEGLETGADDFITKPFDMEELLIRIKNLIDQRQRIREILESKIRKSHSVIQVDFADSGITSMDEQFMQKTIELLKEHHSNPEFSIHDFGSNIGMSTAQLNRKIKALTGQSTGEFIRTFRLTRAAELIRKKSGIISEIAYDVGFSSPSYFSECFKQHFGKLPSTYNENN